MAMCSEAPDRELNSPTIQRRRKTDYSVIERSAPTEALHLEATRLAIMPIL
jgi:hypothetical protein